MSSVQRGPSLLLTGVVLKSPLDGPLDSESIGPSRGDFSTTPVSSKDGPLWTLDNFLVTCPLSASETREFRNECVVKIPRVSISRKPSFPGRGFARDIPRISASKVVFKFKFSRSCRQTTLAEPPVDTWPPGALNGLVGVGWRHYLCLRAAGGLQPPLDRGPPWWWRRVSMPTPWQRVL